MKKNYYFFLWLLTAIMSLNLISVGASAANNNTSSPTCSTGVVRACIDSISPNPANQGESITFKGYGESDDSGKTISKYHWKLGLNNTTGKILAKKRSNFSTSTVPVGTHVIYFRVGTPKLARLSTEWSKWVSKEFTVNPSTTFIICGNNVCEQGENSHNCLQDCPITDNPPVADAGLDQTVKVGDVVYLNGLKSYDPDGNLLTYQWTQTLGMPVVIQNANQAQAQFIAPDTRISLKGFNLSALSIRVVLEFFGLISAQENDGLAFQLAVTAKSKTTTDDVKITVLPKLIDLPPSVSITNPSNGDIINYIASTIKTSVSDDVGVAKVEFYIDGRLAGAVLSPPYKYVWETASAGNGDHTIIVKAYDTAGNTTDSAPVKAKVNYRPPSVTIVRPSNGFQIPFYGRMGTVDVDVDVNSSATIFEIGLLINGLSYQKQACLTCEIDKPSLKSAMFTWGSDPDDILFKPGRYTLQGWATDLVNKKFSNTITVDIYDAVFPEVKINSPYDYSRLVYNNLVDVAIGASDNAALEFIELLIDGRSYDKWSCYYNCDYYKHKYVSFPWRASDVTLGSHTLQARAFDGRNTRLSDSIRITAYDPRSTY